MSKNRIPRAVFVLALALSTAGGGTGTAGRVAPGANAPTPPSLPSPHAADGTQLIEHYPEREEINKTFQLARGARVDVSNVGGPVEVETTDGAGAEIHIVRSAPNRAELDCYRIHVEHTPNRLAIRPVQAGTGGRCQSYRSRESARLKVPRSVNLSLHTIGGDVSLGPLDGALRLRTLGGTVRLAQVSEAEITSVGGGLSLGIARLNPRGVQITNVGGPLELGVSESLNAELRLSNVRGGISVDLPGVAVRKLNNSSQRAQLRGGGAPVSITNVSGGVRVRRL